MRGFWRNEVVKCNYVKERRVTLKEEWDEQEKREAIEKAKREAMEEQADEIELA